MHPLAHHMGEDSLLNLLLLGGGGLSLMVIEGRARLAAGRNRLARLRRRESQGMEVAMRPGILTDRPDRRHGGLGDGN
jgi:predicted lysophospholipase L1 biosynthesis ABC-type transport system permease subunit